MNTQWFDSQDSKYLEHFLGDKKKPKMWDKKIKKTKKPSRIHDISYLKPESCKFYTNNSTTRKFPVAISSLCFVFSIMPNSGDQFI